MTQTIQQLAIAAKPALERMIQAGQIKLPSAAPTPDPFRQAKIEWRERARSDTTGKQRWDEAKARREAWMAAHPWATLEDYQRFYRAEWMKANRKGKKQVAP